MSEKAKIIVLKLGETVAESIVSDIITFLMLAACVWVSGDSVVWTIISAIMFITFGISKIFQMLGRVSLPFRTKNQVRVWLDNLEE